MKLNRKLKVIEAKLGNERVLGIADYENFNIIVNAGQKPYDYFNTL